MKGYGISYMMVIEGMITAMVLLSSGNVLAQAYADKVDELTTDIKVDRVKNAAITISQFNNASVSIEMSSYSISYDQGEKMINVSYSDSIWSSTRFDANKYHYGCVKAPGSSTDISGDLCVSKKPTDENSCQVDTPPGFEGKAEGYALEIDPSGC